MQKLERETARRSGLIAFAHVFALFFMPGVYPLASVLSNEHLSMNAWGRSECMGSCMGSVKAPG